MSDVLVRSTQLLSAEDTAVLKEEQDEGVGEVKSGLFGESGVALHNGVVAQCQKYSYIYASFDYTTLIAVPFSSKI